MKDLETLTATWDARWSTWDLDGRRWRHWARSGGRIVETNAVGVPLSEVSA